MAIVKLVGGAPNQVPRNKDLGNLAFQDAENIAGPVGIGGALTLNQGTANGVPYLNANKALTTSAALTFDGTNLSSIGGFSGQALNATGTPVAFTATGGGVLSYSGGGLAVLRAYSNAGGAAGALAFSASGSEDMRLTSTGLGIGTNSPGSKLSVFGLTSLSAASGSTAINVTGATPSVAGGQGMLQILSTDAAAADAGGVLNFSANTTSVANYVMAGIAGKYQATGSGVYGGYLQFLTTSNNGSPTERMRIDASGNLGLGITPSAWNAGYKALEINIVGNGISTQAGAGAQLNITNNAAWVSGWKYGVADLATLYSQQGGQHRWFTAPSGTAGNAISFTQAMTLDVSGNLSVGTTATPTQISFNGSSGITYQRSTDNTFSGVLDYLKSRGSAASPTAVQNNDDLFMLRVAPYHGSAYAYLNSQVISVDGAFTSGQTPPIRITWFTNIANGSSTERVRIDSSGNLIQSAPATAPTLTTNGQMVFNLTSNTNLRVSVRGSDGVTRTANLTLA